MDVSQSFVTQRTFVSYVKAHGFSPIGRYSDQRWLGMFRYKKGDECNMLVSDYLAQYYP